MVFGLGKSGGAANADGGLIKTGTSSSFPADVIDASRAALVLVDFWAAWCGPCKQLTPVLEKVVKSYGGKVRLVKINTDEQPAVAAQLRVQSLPTVYAFRDGRPLDGFTGAQPEAAVRAFIDKLLAGDAEDGVEALIAEADQALDAGDLQGAATLYAAVLQEEQHNPAALAGLAKCYLKSGDTARAEQTLSLVPHDKRAAPAVQSVKAALDLARMADGKDNRPELEAKIAANPKDHQSRFDLAVALAAREEKLAAIEHLLEIVRRERAWNEEAARKQLLKLFDAWGPKDAATNEGRRRLSSLLFS